MKAIYKAITSLVTVLCTSLVAVEGTVQIGNHIVTPCRYAIMSHSSISCFKIVYYRECRRLSKIGMGLHIEESCVR